jgi:hypothetical protein
VAVIAQQVPDAVLDSQQAQAELGDAIAASDAASTLVDTEVARDEAAVAAVDAAVEQVAAVEEQVAAVDQAVADAAAIVPEAPAG